MPSIGIWKKIFHSYYWFMTILSHKRYFVHDSNKTLLMILALSLMIILLLLSYDCCILIEIECQGECNIFNRFTRQRFLLLIKFKKCRVGLKYFENNSWRLLCRWTSFDVYWAEYAFKIILPNKIHDEGLLLDFIDTWQINIIMIKLNSMTQI